MRCVTATLLFVTSGCNAIFGLTPTEGAPPVDARFFDAPIDAPFGCPPIGVAPVFSKLLHQVPAECTDFNTHGAVATAMCFADQNVQVAEGPPDGPFTQLPLFASSGNDNWDQVRLAPEGDRLFVRHIIGNLSLGIVSVFRRGSGGWEDDGGMSAAVDEFVPYVEFGTPSRGPAPRILINNRDGLIREYELDANHRGTERATYVTTDFGVTLLDYVPNLSPDGLRVLVSGLDTNQRRVVMYGDRPTLDRRFTMTQVDVPIGATPFLADDCSRIYLSAASSVLWVQRL